ncbi:radical SAM protein [Candidatus Margulisiibacteriota bacterium]
MKTTIEKGIYVLEYEGKLILFDPESFLVFPLQKLSNLTSDTSKYINQTINTISKMKQDGQLNTVLESNPYKPHITRIFLHLSNKCNLKCTYCYANTENHEYKETIMDKKTIDQALSFLINLSPDRDKYNIVFFGGEPLLFPDLMQYTENSIRNKYADKRFVYSLTTNGTLLTKKSHAFLKKNKVSVMLSLDGDKTNHDRNRINANGVGSYDAIMENIDKYKTLPAPTSARVTLTKGNYDLIAIYEHLKMLKIDSVLFLPVSLESADPHALDSADISKFKKEFSKLAAYYLSCLMKEEKTTKILNFTGVLRQLYQRIPNKRHCGMACNRLAISSNGDIYPCQRFVGNKQYCMGNVNTTFDQKKMVYFSDITNVENISTCANCIAQYICAGGCYYDSVLYNGDLCAPYKNNCDLMQHIVSLGIVMFGIICQQNEQKLDTV